MSFTERHKIEDDFLCTKKCNKGNKSSSSAIKCLLWFDEISIQNKAFCSVDFLWYQRQSNSHFFVLWLTVEEDD